MSKRSEVVGFRTADRRFQAQVSAVSVSSRTEGRAEGTAVYVEQTNSFRIERCSFVDNEGQTDRPTHYGPESQSRTDPVILQPIPGARIDLSTDTPIEWSFDLVGASPAREETRLALGVPLRAELRMDVLDVTGRRLWHRTASFAAGRHELTWPLETNNGDKIPTGVYWMVVRTPEGNHTRRLTVVR